MPTDPRRAIALAAALAALAIAACDDKSDAERCSELEEYLAGREADLSRDCAVDDDCKVVFVRPDNPIAATRQPDDPALARVVAEYRDACGDLRRASGDLSAVCVERVIDVPDRNDPRNTVQENLGRSCVLRGSVERPDAADDAGADLGDADGSGDVDEPVCACANDTDCNADSFCACVCVPDTLCGRACGNAVRCDAMDGLGLGSDAAVCAAACEAAIADGSGDFIPFASCLRDAPCDALVACRDALP